MARRHVGICPDEGPWGCTACEAIAEARAEERRDVEPEQLDRHGADADWALPRGYGGF